MADASMWRRGSKRFDRRFRFGVLETLGYVLGAIARVIGVVFVGGLVLLFIVCWGIAIRL